MSIITAVITTAVLASTALNADMMLGKDVPHGDPLFPESEISTYAASDVARYYPSGSYYSLNRKECECHGTINCSTGYRSCNCNSYTYYQNGYNNADGTATAWQCNGFARFCYREYNGMDVKYYISNGMSKSLTENNLYEVLSSIGSSSFICGYTQSGRGHSIFVTGFTKSKVVVWEANYDGRCLVKNIELSYSEFLKRINKIDWAYSSGGVLTDY